MSLHITSAKYVAPLSVRLQFSDGAEQIVDVGAFIRRHPHPQYNAYLKEHKFKQFTIEEGDVVWGKNWDLVFPIEQLRAGAI